jgi:hypothetical protein
MQEHKTQGTIIELDRHRAQKAIKETTDSLMYQTYQSLSRARDNVPAPILVTQLPGLAGLALSFGNGDHHSLIHLIVSPVGCTVRVNPEWQDADPDLIGAAAASIPMFLRFLDRHVPEAGVALVAQPIRRACKPLQAAALH